MQIKTKVCTQCKEEKLLFEFSRRKGGVDGVFSRCKKCVKNSRKETEIEKLRRTMPYEKGRNWKERKLWGLYSKKTK